MAQPKLEVLQRWAERYAQKLGISDPIRVGLSRDCEEKKHPTHCHINKDDRRGLICWDARDSKPKSGYMARLRGWKWLIAHEVCHLKVQSHFSPYFARYMASLGFKEEKRVAVAAGLMQHRHQWENALTDLGDGRVERRCLKCRKTQIGVINWKEA